MVWSGHEEHKSPAGLARRTAATRLGAERTGLETNRDRGRPGGHVWGGEPMVEAGACRRRRGRAAGASRAWPRPKAHARATRPAARPAGPWSGGLWLWGPGVDV